MLARRPELLRYWSRDVAVGIRPENQSRTAESPYVLNGHLERVEALGSDLLGLFSHDAAGTGVVEDGELAISGQGVAQLDPCCSVKRDARTSFAIDPPRMNSFDRDSGVAVWE